LATFDSTGTLLASTSDFNEVPRRLPSDRSAQEMILAAPTTFTAVSNSNYRRNYSIIPLADGLFLMGSWRTDQQTNINGIALSAYLMPVLMWLSGMLVALLAADRLVVRHISRLRQPHPLGSWSPSRPLGNQPTGPRLSGHDRHHPARRG
jgi:hypothetical protein